jgi:hypothetical protein
MEVRLKADRGGYVSIDVTMRENPKATDYWDGKWLESRVRLAAGGFRAEFAATLRAEEFVRFRDGVRACMTNLTGTFEFATMEHQLEIVGSGDGLGHFTAQCIARDVAGIGNELRFELELDQTVLPTWAFALDELVTTYPVVGKSNG